MLEEIIRNTNEFISSVPKSTRKKYGQFFTNETTARFMAGLFNFDLDLDEIQLLDAGAGSGILTAAAVDRIFELGYTGHVHATCYETDTLILSILFKNLQLLSNRYNFSFHLKRENYITSQLFGENLLITDDAEKYDYIIGNPPYKKIGKDADEALCMKDVCYGSPNLYFLFWAMGIFNLKKGKELVYIVPRSWTSGAYFKQFREFLFRYVSISNIHLFERRDKVFSNESILQETVIIKINKTQKASEYIKITTSSDSTFNDLKIFYAPYNTIVSSSKLVYLITSPQDAYVLERVNRLSFTLPECNLKMKTGLIVDFRVTDVLRDKIEEGAYPLLYSQHIKEGKVVWPIGKEGEVIKTNNKSHLQPNGNLLLVKRFTSKEEKRRLQCGIFLKKHYNDFQYISTQNKVNFIECDSPCITYGLYVIFNSSLYDNYYRILNGSTQVNSTEINIMPIPERKVIEEMGKELMNKELSEKNCNSIIDRWIK